MLTPQQRTTPESEVLNVVTDMQTAERPAASLRAIYEDWLESVPADVLFPDCHRLPLSERTGDAFLPPHEPDFVTKKHTHDVAIGIWLTCTDGRQMSWCGYYVSRELLAKDGARPTCPECLERRASLNQW